MHRTLPLVLTAVLLAAPTLARGEGLPDWIYANPGTHAWLGMDDRDLHVATVCPTVAEYRRYAKSTIAAPGCEEHMMADPIVIDATTPSGIACKPASAVVRIHAEKDKWSGYTSMGNVIPAIPAGALLTLRPIKGQRATIATSQGAGSNAGIDLGTSANVVVEKFVVDYVAGDEGRNLLVRVNSGPYFGKQGWTYASQTSVFDGTGALNMQCPPGAV